jgi:hypothetical protein
MASGELKFDSDKRDRGWYFVEYTPPQVDNWFAMLCVQVVGTATDEAVAAAMEREADLWLHRYPIPIMVAAFDDTGDLRDLAGTRPSSHLMTYIDVSTGQHRRSWSPPSDDEIPHEELDDATLLRVYSQIPVTRTTEADREGEFRVFARRVRTGRRLVITWLIIWLAVIPAALAILEWAGPKWLGVVVLVYALFKALKQALKLLDIWKPSSAELEAQEKTQRMQHYYDECEKNPEGFERLKIENLDREARERTREEARALRNGQA